MNFNETTNDSDWNLTPLKKENEIKEEKKTTIKKENRNFCERWLSIFSPWLSRCYDNPNRPFCRACQRPLDNNRFRLQRHERTAKHARNQEVLLNEGEDAIRLLLSRSRRRNIKKEILEKSKLFVPKFEKEIPLQKLTPQNSTRTPDDKNDKSGDSNNLYSKREYFDMSNYYYSMPHSRPPQPRKDSFDLFFEAISASVKNLPPKLAAEVKSRISQVITEFELRAICEKEAQEKEDQTVITMPSQVTNVVAIDPVINDINTNSQRDQCAPTVTQYVYSYQQKKDVN